MIATLTAYDAEGRVSHADTRAYPSLAFLWEHVGCQQNNQKTTRVSVETESGIEYEIAFSPWTPERRYLPSGPFQQLLAEWCLNENEHS